MVVEGAELLAAALDAGAPVESVYVAPGGWLPGDPVDHALTAGARVFDLAPGVIERAADTVNPQPVISIVGFEPAALADLGPARDDGLVVVCAEIRDPGNAGTVVRVADAVGADAVVFSDGTVDPTNPKTVRASAGSLFHLPVMDGGTVSDVVGHLHDAGFVTVGTLARGGTDYVAFDWCRPVAVVLGNEAAGLPPEVTDALDATVTVTLAGRAESLNVSTAAAVVCFEARRQRIAAGWAPRRSSGPTGAGSTMPGMKAATGTAVRADG